MNRVLVIDDSRTMTDMLWNCLSSEGFDVITAENGNQGIKAIEEYRPDLVLTDIIMPEKNGIEVAMYLRMNYPDIRVIAMTSGGTISAQDHLNNIMKLGADYMLKKPFKKDEVLHAISSAMDLVAA